MKRVWTEAAIGEHEPGVFIVLLDGKPVRRPDGTPLHLPSRNLANAIAAEWDAAGADGKNFTPDDLPLTRLAITAAERIAPHRDSIVQQLAAYGRNDLLCYRAEEPALAADEAKAWQPWLDWTASRYGISLQIGEGITPIRQPESAGSIFQNALAASSDYDLAGLGVIVPALGSLVLGLALAEDKLPAEEACRLSQLDELWQERRWGTDHEAASRRKLILADVAASLYFMVLCRA